MISEVNPEADDTGWEKPVSLGDMGSVAKSDGS